MPKRQRPPGGGGRDDPSPIVSGLLLVLDDVLDIADEATRAGDWRRAKALVTLVRQVANCIDTCHDRGPKRRKPFT